MSQSLCLNLVHLIYSTKNREPNITPEVAPKLFAFQAGVFQEWQCPALIIGGTADHVHTLFMLSKNHALIKIIEEVKRASSKWIKTEDASLASFHWQNGYGAFSVSQSHVAKVRRYIEQQIEHHRTRTFQEEFRLFLKRHNVEYDERYVWDLGIVVPFQGTTLGESGTQGVGHVA